MRPGCGDLQSGFGCVSHSLSDQERTFCHLCNALSQCLLAAHEGTARVPVMKYDDAQVTLFQVLSSSAEAAAKSGAGSWAKH